MFHVCSWSCVWCLLTCVGMRGQIEFRQALSGRVSRSCRKSVFVTLGLLMWYRVSTYPAPRPPIPYTARTSIAMADIADDIDHMVPADFVIKTTAVSVESHALHFKHTFDEKSLKQCGGKLFFHANLTGDGIKRLLTLRNARLRVRGLRLYDGPSIISHIDKVKSAKIEELTGARCDVSYSRWSKTAKAKFLGLGPEIQIEMAAVDDMPSHTMTMLTDRPKGRPGGPWIELTHGNLEFLSKASQVEFYQRGDEDEAGEGDGGIGDDVGAGVVMDDGLEAGAGGEASDADVSHVEGRLSDVESDVDVAVNRPMAG